MNAEPNWELCSFWAHEVVVINSYYFEVKRPRLYGHSLITTHLDSGSISHSSLTACLGSFEAGHNLRWNWQDMTTRPWQIMLFFVPIILVDYSQEVSLLLQFGVPIV